MKILVTGNAGFIGFHLCKTLLSINNFKNNTIVGLDNLNNYYDIKLKKDRLKFLKKISKNKKYFFYKIDLCNYKNLKKIFRKYKFDTVIHLAAQAGVRASIKKPSIYTNSNLVGTFNLIDIAKEFKIKHFLFASTSVYMEIIITQILQRKTTLIFQFSIMQLQKNLMKLCCIVIVKYIQFLLHA